jgi:beta-phosphoglucomutase-like phosphatase (HAD superfamily)
MKKVNIKIKETSLSLYDLDGYIIVTPEDAWNAFFGSCGYKSSDHIYKSFIIDYNTDYNRDEKIDIYGVREETDKEFETRCIKEKEIKAKERLLKKAQKVKTEQKEKELLKKLKEKCE